MISLCKKMFIALMVMGFGSSLFAYEWTFNNHTGKRLMISMKLVGKGNRRFWSLVSPDTRTTFEWGFPYCYSSIEIIEFKPTNEKFLELSDGAYGDNSDPALLAYLDSAIWSIPTIMYTKNPESSAFRAKLMETITDLTVAGVKMADEAVVGYTGTKALQVGGKKFEDKLAAMTGLLSSSIEKSACTSRTFDVYAATEEDVMDNKEKTHFILVTRFPKEMVVDQPSLAK